MSRKFRTLAIVITIIFMATMLSASISAYEIMPSSKDSIIPPDERVYIDDSSRNEYPYISLAYLTFWYDCVDENGNQCGSRGTGFFITDKSILTAAHNFSCAKANHKDTSKVVRIDIGIVAKVSGYTQTYTVTSSTANMYIPAAYSADKKNYDYACIHLTAGSLAAPVLTLYNAPESELEASNLICMGYDPLTPPNNEPFVKQNPYLYKGVGKSTRLNEHIIYYNIDTDRGQSGSPVMIMKDGKYQVVAIHTSGTGEDNKGESNSGVRITQAVINDLLMRGFYQQ